MIISTHWRRYYRCLFLLETFLIPSSVLFVCHPTCKVFRKSAVHFYFISSHCHLNFFAFSSNQEKHIKVFFSAEIQCSSLLDWTFLTTAISSCFCEYVKHKKQNSYHANLLNGPAYNTETKNNIIAVPYIVLIQTLLYLPTHKPFC